MDAVDMNGVMPMMMAKAKGKINIVKKLVGDRTLSPSTQKHHQL